MLETIPVLVHLLWIYYGLPSIFGGGLSFNPFAAGVITLVLHESAFISEIYRSGIQAIKKGQIEAARSLGLKPSLVFKVTLPQAIRIMLRFNESGYLYFENEFTYISDRLRILQEELMN